MMDDGSSVGSDPSSDTPEVTISPADNGHVVRWHQRGDGKKTEGRTIRRVAMSSDEALGHAADALGGAGKAKSAKKKSLRSVGRGEADEAGEASSAPAAHSMRTRSARPRRRARVSGRRA